MLVDDEDDAKDAIKEDILVQRALFSVIPALCVQKLEEQDKKALNMKEQLQREHRYLKRRLEQLSVSGSVERVRTDSMGSTISTDSEQGTLTSKRRVRRLCYGSALFLTCSLKGCTRNASEMCRDAATSSVKSGTAQLFDMTISQIDLTDGRC